MKDILDLIYQGFRVIHPHVFIMGTNNLSWAPEIEDKEPLSTIDEVIGVDIYGEEVIGRLCFYRDSSKLLNSSVLLYP